MESEGLFNQGKSFQYVIQSVMSYVQNEGVVYTDEDMSKFDQKVKDIIVSLGVWKMDVLMYMQNDRKEEVYEGSTKTLREIRS